MSKGQSSWAEHLSAVQPCPCTVTKLPQSKAEPVLPMASNSGQNQRLPSYSGNQEKKRLFQLDSPFYKYLFYFLGQRCIEFFQQWLGWIPRWNLCKGCTGPCSQSHLAQAAMGGKICLSCAISCTQVYHHQKSARTLQRSPS